MMSDIMLIVSTSVIILWYCTNIDISVVRHWSELNRHNDYFWQCNVCLLCERIWMPHASSWAMKKENDHDDLSGIDVSLQWDEVIAAHSLTHRCCAVTTLCSLYKSINNVSCSTMIREHDIKFNCPHSIEPLKHNDDYWNSSIWMHIGVIPRPSWSCQAIHWCVSWKRRDEFFMANFQKFIINSLMCYSISKTMWYNEDRTMSLTSFF